MAQHVRTRHEDGQGSAEHADVAVPSPRSGTERGAPRPFAHGSVDVVIPAPRTGSPGAGGVAAPAPPTRTPSTPGYRTPLLVAGSLVAVVLLLSGLYTAATMRERSPQVSSPVPTAVLHDVTYSVTTGHGSAIVVDYSRSGGGEYGTGSATDVPSPWHVSTRVDDYYGPSISATIVPASPDAPTDDSITCTILENGRTVAQATQSGPGASVSCVR